MTDTEYIEKTRPVVDFLMTLCDGNTNMLATTLNAQAEQDTDLFIEALTVIKKEIEQWITELETLKTNE